MGQDLLEVAKRMVLAVREMKRVYDMGNEPSEEECTLSIGAVLSLGEELDMACKRLIAEMN